MPAIFSSALPNTSSAAWMVLAVNCGNVIRTARKNMKAPASTIRATLRYVTVFHLIWIPDLRLSEDTGARKPLLNLSEYAVKENVSTSQMAENTAYQFGTLPWCDDPPPASGRHRLPASGFGLPKQWQNQTARQLRQPEAEV